jgi:hypothetical protein
MKTIPFSTVRRVYAELQPTGHWFDRGAIDFFKTVLPANAYVVNDATLFVTRETNPSGEKRFSIRRQVGNGSINTVGEFHSYPTAAAARAEIKRLGSAA